MDKYFEYILVIVVSAGILINYEYTALVAFTLKCYFHQIWNHRCLVNNIREKRMAE